MSRAAVILFPGPTTWRAARVEGQRIDWSDVAAAPTPAETAERVVATLRANGYDGSPVVVALPSEACLAARIATAGLPRNDRRAMLYRFEEMLPVAAEDVVADFAIAGDGALGVCALLDRVRPTIDALEAAGIPVRSITPAALAAALCINAEMGRKHAGPDAILIIAEPTEMASIVALRDDHPIDWAYVPADADAVRLRVELMCSHFAALPRVIAAGLDALTRGAWAVAIGREIETSGRGMRDATASACAADAVAPWFELRRDALAAADAWREIRRPLNVLLATLAAALAIATVAIFLRAARYARVESDAAARMASDFRAQFPDWAVPANVRAVVASEHRREAAANGTPAVAAKGAAAAGAGYGTAFTTLRDVLVALPADGKYAVERMSFQDASFELAGRLEAYEQVDALAAAARKSGMDVATPQTRRNAAGNWAFVLQGARAAGGTP